VAKRYEELEDNEDALSTTASRDSCADPHLRCSCCGFHCPEVHGFYTQQL